MRHTGTQAIETERLRLRRVSEADAPAMYENWAADPAVTRFLRFTPHENIGVSRALLADWNARYACDTHYLWGIERKADGVLMGTIGVSPSEHDAAVQEPGYCIGRAFWGCGYMTEALHAVVAYMFSTVGVGRLDCCHAVENLASGRVIQKNGFVFQREDVYHKFDGTPVPCRCYTITKENYERNFAG